MPQIDKKTKLVLISVLKYRVKQKILAKKGH